jgi:hypothetical protein
MDAQSSVAGRNVDREGTAGAEKLTQAFEESYRTVMGNVVEAQRRNFELAQGWVDGLTGLLESQTEANKALT